MENYVLGVDVGNTNTVFGLFSEESSSRKDTRILKSWRTHTRRERTSDELGIFLRGFLLTQEIPLERIRGFIYSSVVPAFNIVVERMVRDYFPGEPLRVHYQNVPLKFVYPRPQEIGADRLVNAVAARALYEGDLIVIDLGTATTFCVLHGEEYVGGVIAPGLGLSMESLTRNAALLRSAEFAPPASGVIGDSTEHALQSGFFYGWVGLLRGIQEEIKKKNPERTYATIATGGFASLIRRETSGLFDAVDPDLTLKGLALIYRGRKNSNSP